LKLKLSAGIATTLVIIVGLAIISPLFFVPNSGEPKQKVMLSFSVDDTNGVTDWCKNLSQVLNKYNYPAALFIVGKIAEANPQAVTCFSDKVTIGSQTYSNVDLTTIQDYSLKLLEVQKGKEAVDEASHIKTEIFKAPFDSIDDDIYSLLSRSGIIADFSYTHQFNVFENTQFIKVNATTYKAQNYLPDYFLSLAQTSMPLIIEFDSTWTISQIDAYLKNLGNGVFDFVNAQDLVQLVWTRGI
jgi:peptidoglycan/xylan/chitin deacetylase (PgdA/CDA1 family)